MAIYFHTVPPDCDWTQLVGRPDVETGTFLRSKISVDTAELRLWS